MEGEEGEGEEGGKGGKEGVREYGSRRFLKIVMYWCKHCCMVRSAWPAHGQHMATAWAVQVHVHCTCWAAHALCYDSNAPLPLPCAPPPSPVPRFWFAGEDSSRSEYQSRLVEGKQSDLFLSGYDFVPSSPWNTTCSR